jgi:photosystem I subunit 8
MDLLYNKRKIIKKCMTAAYLPSILVPLVGLFFPGISMAFLFIYIEQEKVS